MDYTRLARGDSTAPGFVVPADQVVARGAVRARRAARRLEHARSGGTRRCRTGWRAWGSAGLSRSSDRSARFPALRRVTRALSRDQPAARRHGSRAAWMAGSDLDRFSRYTFGTFDNRLARLSVGADSIRPRCRVSKRARLVRRQAGPPGRICRFGRGARSGLRPRPPQLHWRRAARRSAGPVRYAARGRVGLRLPRRQRRRYARHASVPRSAATRCFEP